MGIGPGKYKDVSVNYSYDARKYRMSIERLLEVVMGERESINMVQVDLMKGGEIHKSDLMNVYYKE